MKLTNKQLEIMDFIFEYHDQIMSFDFLCEHFEKNSKTISLLFQKSMILKFWSGDVLLVSFTGEGEKYITRSRKIRGL